MTSVPLAPTRQEDPRTGHDARHERSACKDCPANLGQAEASR